MSGHSESNIVVGLQWHSTTLVQSNLERKSPWAKFPEGPQIHMEVTHIIVLFLLNKVEDWVIMGPDSMTRLAPDSEEGREIVSIEGCTAALQSLASLDPWPMEHRMGQRRKFKRSKCCKGRTGFHPGLAANPIVPQPGF